MAENTDRNAFAEALEGKWRGGRRPVPPPETGPGGKKFVGGRLAEAVAYRLKVLAAEERTSVLALLCEGINHVFEVRGLTPIAGIKT